MSKIYKVKPINKISDIPKGTFSWIYDFITDQTVPLKELTEEKEITLLELHETIESGQLDGWIKKQGEPIEPNYLLGLAVQYPEVFEKGKDYVSTASVFVDEDGNRRFLRVRRRGGRRGLRLVRLAGYWNADCDWVFLAESSKLNPESLSPSNSLTLAIDEVKKAGYKVIREY